MMLSNVLVLEMIWMSMALLICALLALNKLGKEEGFKRDWIVVSIMKNGKALIMTPWYITS